jgi:hypothetical protein
MISPAARKGGLGGWELAVVAASSRKTRNPSRNVASPAVPHPRDARRYGGGSTSPPFLVYDLMELGDITPYILVEEGDRDRLAITEAERVKV